MFLVKATLCYPSEEKYSVCPEDFIPGETAIEDVEIFLTKSVPKVGGIRLFETCTEVKPYSEQRIGLHMKEWSAVEVFEYSSEDPGVFERFYEVVFTLDGSTPVRSDWHKLPPPILCIPLPGGNPARRESGDPGYYSLVEHEPYLGKLIKEWASSEVQDFYRVGPRPAAGFDRVVVCSCPN